MGFVKFRIESFERFFVYSAARPFWQEPLAPAHRPEFWRGQGTKRQRTRGILASFDCVQDKFELVSF